MEPYIDPLIHHEKQAAMGYLFKQKEAAGHYTPACPEDYLQKLLTNLSLKNESSSSPPPYTPLLQDFFSYSPTSLYSSPKPPLKTSPYYQL